MTDQCGSRLYEREAAALAAVQRLRFFPLAVTGGDGCWLHEAGGRRLLDLSATWSAAGLGYAHPAVVAAVARAAGDMAGAGAGSVCNPESVGLAEELVATLPGAADRRVYLGHSGSDANEAVVRAIRRATGRRRLVAFHGSYHGGLAGSAQFSGLMVDAGEPADPDLTLLDYPGAAPGTDLPAILARLDAVLGAPGGAAALLVEPVMSDGGIVIPPAGFLRELRDRCGRHGTLLLCDEVKVGLGRTGMLHAFAADGVEPDVVTFGKSLGGGLPLSAAVGPAEVMNVAEAFTMLTTAGNPVCAAAGRAVLRTILAEDLPARAAATGEVFLRGLRELQGRHRCVSEVRGRGLVIGLELRGDASADGSSQPTLAAQVAYRAWELGVVLFYVGPRADVLEITPPLIISAQQVQQAIEIVDRAIGDAEAGQVDKDAVAAYSGW
ncbi:MAG TPA: aminotransferase class III-fold pyridoxal phosphate-dependent enzyme [Streptosporangiaceae bacterium]|nr:aminotransferase class III-fold pyridoxal phosphate-dependent enzyme [Streptosporangiaceae bacterium]